MIDPVVGYDQYNYNNGVPPAAGLAWDGGAWGWPTYDSGTGDTMVLWPATDNSVSDTVKKLVEDDICMRCGQKNCPYIKDGKDYKELRSALRKNDLPLAKKIYVQRFSQFSKRNEAVFKKEIQKREEASINDAIKFTADFYKEVLKAYGEKAEKLASLLANQAKGKKIRSVEDALKAYDKYKANINKKINAKNRETIAKALESIDVKIAAKNLTKFSKGLGYVGPAIDIVDWIKELIKAVKTDSWRSLYVKTETIAIGFGATYVTALVFSAVLGGPVGILGYGLIMAGVGALVNETIVEEANKIIGI